MGSRLTSATRSRADSGVLVELREPYADRQPASLNSFYPADNRRAT